MTFSKYLNRFGKHMILSADLLDKFSATAADLFGQGIEIEMTDGWRGKAEQDKALAAGNSNASFGNSPHNYGVAFDVAPLVDGKLCWPDEKSPNFHLWNKIGKAGIMQDLQWGNDWDMNGIPDDIQTRKPLGLIDRPHFQVKGWRKMGLELYFQEPPTS
jgi:hypothetical protein